MASVTTGRAAVRRRLAQGFGINIFGRGVNTIIQLVSVPVFLKYWGVDLYGEWVLLNSVPNYFALTDVGFGSTAGNEMTMLVAAGKNEEALDVFQSVQLLTTATSVLVGGAMLGSVWFLPFDRWLHLSHVSQHDTKIVILLLVFSVLLTLQEGLLQSSFRCVAKYVYGTFLKNMVQLAAFMGVSGSVILGGGVVRATEVYCGVNALGTLLLFIELRRHVPWIRFGTEHARWATLKRLTGPSLSFMAFPLGNALNLQGMLLLVGHLMGPLAVVIFSTARTVSRVAVQFMQMIGNAMWPEMSLAVGADDWPLARSLHRRGCQFSIWASAAIVVGLAAAGPAAWRHWTVGEFKTDSVLLDIMLLQVLFTSLWMTSQVALAATNRHQKMAAVYLMATSVSLTLAWFTTRTFGLRGAAVAVIAGEIFMSAYVLRASLSFLGDTLSGFVSGMFALPNLGRLRLRRQNG